MGRPTKLDDLTAQRIVDAVRDGLTWALAARVAGVGASTLREWKHRGADGEEPFSAFLARLKRAEAEAAQASIRAIRKAGEDPRHWTAHAWFLERRFRKAFGREDRKGKPGVGPYAADPNGTFTGDLASDVEALRSLLADTEDRLARTKKERKA